MDSLLILNDLEILVSSISTLVYDLVKYVCEKNKMVPSANIISLVNCEILMISLITSINSCGPRIKPRGKPHLTGNIIVEFILFNATY